MRRHLAPGFAIACLTGQALAQGNLAQGKDRQHRHQDAAGLTINPGLAGTGFGDNQRRLSREQPWRFVPGGSLPGKLPGSVSGDTPGTISGSMPGTLSGIAGSYR